MLCSAPGAQQQGRVRYHNMWDREEQSTASCCSLPARDRPRPDEVQLNMAARHGRTRAELHEDDDERCADEHADQRPPHRGGVPHDGLRGASAAAVAAAGPAPCHGVQAMRGQSEQRGGGRPPRVPEPNAVQVPVVSLGHDERRGRL